MDRRRFFTCAGGGLAGTVLANPAFARAATAAAPVSTYITGFARVAGSTLPPAGTE